MKYSWTQPRGCAAKLDWWPDGNIGLIPLGGGRYHFYAANSTKPARATGTLSEPAMLVEQIVIESNQTGLSYLAGGPVYRDPASGHTLLVYHAEVHRGSGKNFYSLLGLAVSVDDSGLRFKDLGPIVQAQLTEQQAKGVVEVTGGPMIVVGDYFHLYFRDKLTDSTNVNLAVARAKVSDVITAAIRGQAHSWTKYHVGEFSESAITGASSPLEADNPQTRWMDVTYSRSLRCYLMVIAANDADGSTNLHLSASNDGLAWSPRQRLTSDNGESFYPSLLIEQDASGGERLHVYYTHSIAGGFDRWTDASLVRRELIVSLTRQ